MLKQFRRKIIHHLWDHYRESTAQVKQIENQLTQKGISPLILDHFAIIDLPGPNTGIPHLKELFSTIGYVEQGKDYLPEKQNDFLWMAEIDSAHRPAKNVLPQVVVADFRLEELPHEIKRIIEKYSRLAKASPLNELKHFLPQLISGDAAIAHSLHDRLMGYLSGRDWPLPTLSEFRTVQEFNELLSWVLIFGRRPNHFTLSIHLLDHFKSLDDFHRFITDEVQLKLNLEGGIIKGGKMTGIAQGSTVGIKQIVSLHDGTIEIPTGFVEFVWRYERDTADIVHKQKPLLWSDYFTGFIAHHADNVIESLYVSKNVSSV